METAFREAIVSYLVRYQQTAIKETGRRPLARARKPMDDELVVPGCQRPGYVFWQPVPWRNDQPPFGKHKALFHESVRDYLSICRFLEIRFRLPVTQAKTPLRFLYDRVFETYANTRDLTPGRAFDAAALAAKESPDAPFGYCMAATCDDGEPLQILLMAKDGQVCFTRADGGEPVYGRMTVERLLPKLQFVYEL